MENPAEGMGESIFDAVGLATNNPKKSNSRNKKLLRELKNMRKDFPSTFLQCRMIDFHFSGDIIDKHYCHSVNVPDVVPNTIFAVFLPEEDRANNPGLYDSIEGVCITVEQGELCIINKSSVHEFNILVSLHKDLFGEDILDGIETASREESRSIHLYLEAGQSIRTPIPRPEGTNTVNYTIVFSNQVTV